MKKVLLYIGLLLTLSTILLTGCNQSTNDIVNKKQEARLQEAVKQVDTPNIKNWRELRILKDIYEMRDQELATYSYVWSEFIGKYRFIGESIGYPIPASTQFSAPTKSDGKGYAVPNAEPNGTYSPASAEGTWIMMKVPGQSKVVPTYHEERVSTFPYKLDPSIVINP